MMSSKILRGVVLLIMAQFGTASFAASPAVPQIDWMTPTVNQGSKGQIKWNIWWQQPNQMATSWKVMVNNQQIASSTEFVVNTPNTQSGQTTVFTYATSGVKNIVVMVCNNGGNDCTPSAPYIVTVNPVAGASSPQVTTGGASQPSSGGSAQAPFASAAPAKMQITWMDPNVLTGNNVNVGADIWWQDATQAATLINAYIDGVKVSGGAANIVNPTPNTQRFVQGVAFPAAGTHLLTLEACNSKGCTKSDPYTFNVKASGGGAAVAAAVTPVSSSVTTPAVATPAVATPAVATPAVATPAVITPAVATPAVATPAVATPAVATPAVATAAVATAAVATPAVATPAVATPAVATPAVATAAVVTPAVATPAVATPAVATPVATGIDPVSIAASVKASQAGRYYVGYYPTWSDNWFSSTTWDGKALTDDAILQASNLAKVPGTYTHVVLAFAQPNFAFNGRDWQGTGLNFNATVADIKRSIDVLHQRGMKVLLAVGGATYNDWGALSAEGFAGSGTITTALTNAINTLGLDGLDVDFEVEGADENNVKMYAGSIKAMANAVRSANRQASLTLAGWSTGADCTAAAPCSLGKSFWGGSAGRERLVFTKYPELKPLVNMVSIMSYDALGTPGPKQHYDPVVAWQQYRDMFPSSTVVNIGLENAAEGWAGGVLVNRNEDAATCASSGVTTITDDQYGRVVNQPYSVERVAAAVTATRATSNLHDGAMLWQILKQTNSSCSKAATPSSITSIISAGYKLPLDVRNPPSVFAK